MIRRLAAALIACLFLAGGALAHEIRPAFLDLKETAPGQFSVLWKVPVLSGQPLRLSVRLPSSCTGEPPAPSLPDDVYWISRWQVTCPTGLQGSAIAIDGLRITLTDVLARIEYADGTAELARMTPETPEFTAKGQMAWHETAWTYFALGVEHILFGIDHLLFVLALMLLIRGRRALLKTITAFTIAHSITLAGASLGFFSLPQQPVEATIALSIAFVASELVKLRDGPPRLSQTYPWIVAFAFGLLHGFGFAGALAEIGLPQKDVPLALLMFNVGVEAGQVLFVFTMLVVWRGIGALVAVPVGPAKLVAAYAIGAVAMFWLLTRVGGMLG